MSLIILKYKWCCILISLIQRCSYCIHFIFPIPHQRKNHRHTLSTYFRFITILVRFFHTLIPIFIIQSQFSLCAVVSDSTAPRVCMGNSKSNNSRHSTFLMVRFILFPPVCYGSPEDVRSVSHRFCQSTKYLPINFQMAQKPYPNLPSTRKSEFRTFYVLLLSFH